MPQQRAMLNKVTEYSFHACSYWCHSACTQGFEIANMALIQWSFDLHNAHTIFIILNKVYWWFCLLLQRYVGQSINVKNPAILRFFFVTERARTECGIASSEICLFLENNLLEFQGNLAQKLFNRAWKILRCSK